MAKNKNKQQPSVGPSIRPASAAHVLVKKDTWSTAGLSVLIVSDNGSLRDSIAKGFKEIGYTTNVAASSIEGLKAVKSSEIDIVVVSSILEGASSADFLNLIENVSLNKEIVVLIVCDNFNDKGLSKIETSLKNLCIAKSDLSTERLAQSARQLLDPTFDPVAEKKKIKGRVLVAEADEERQKAITECLLDSGLEVVPARDTNGGLDKAREKLPDVIIVDADISPDGAIEFIRKSKSDPALESIPCLVLCDEVSRGKVRSGAFSVGALGCVMYPINKDEVLAQVGVMAKLTQTMAEIQEHAVSLAVSNFELNETRGLLEQKTKELERSGDFKSEFLAKMSHELRTPLTAMLGFAQRLLHMEPGDPDHNDAIRTIMRNGDHLLELINDILDLSKIEAGKLSIDPRPCSPLEILQDVKALMRIRAEQKGIAFFIEYQSDIPSQIITDSMRVKQIILNLVGNAIKFTQKGSVKVVVGCSPAEETILFQIVDTGMGMSPEAKERLFKAFEQGDTDVTRKFGGTGLGLTISLQLAELLGGTVSVDSILGMGSSFKVTIKTGPLKDVKFISPTEAEQVKQKDVDEDAIEITKLTGRIIVAEDNADNRRLLEFYLKKSGASFSFVENGRDAVSKVLNENPDVVLMDMQMPIMNGYDATKKIREQGFTRPIIALTANALDVEVKKCIDAGCNRVLPKPFNWNALFGLLKDHIGAKGSSEHIVKLAAKEPSAQIALEGQSSKGTTNTPESAITLGPIVSPLYLESPELQPLIGEFLESLDQYRSSIRTATKAKDWAGLKQTAHDVSGVSGMYGYPECSDLAKKLRLACMQKNTEEICGLSDNLIAILDRMKLGLAVMKGEVVAISPSQPETRVIVSDLVSLSPELIPQVLEFLDNVDAVLSKIQSACLNKNWPELTTVSNEVAGTAQLFGYPSFAEVAKEVEEAAIAQDSNKANINVSKLADLKDAMLRGRSQIPS